MTDEELRNLVRDTVLRHLSAAPGPTPAATLNAAFTTQSGEARHHGFARYALPRGTELEGPCLIEPTVRCNHCGYCQSHGY